MLGLPAVVGVPVIVRAALLSVVLAGTVPVMTEPSVAPLIVVDVPTVAVDGEIASAFSTGDLAATVIFGTARRLATWTGRDRRIAVRADRARRIGSRTGQDRRAEQPAASVARGVGRNAVDASQQSSDLRGPLGGDRARCREDGR